MDMYSKKWVVIRMDATTQVVFFSFVEMLIPGCYRVVML